MIRGFYSARSGLIAHQERMNVIGNNIANVNTVGFKPMRTAFKDLIYQNLNRTSAGEGRELYRNPVEAEPLHVGHGVKINKVDILIGQGAPSPTGRELDFCLTDENAFFSVMTAGGEYRYTRNGNFAWMNADDTWYLVNGNGEYVTNREGEPIEVEPDENGKLVVPYEEFGVFSFENPFGLWSMEGTTFYPTPESGEPQLIENPSMLQNYLENSSTEIANEMVNMIEAQRAFSFNSRMVQTADEVEQIVNALR